MDILFSAVSLREERGFKGHSNLPSLEFEKQRGNFCFFIFLQLFNCLPSQYPHRQGKGYCQAKVDRYEQGEGVENWR